MFWGNRLSYKDRLLTLGAVFLETVFGELTVAVIVKAFPGWGTAGVALIKASITVFGIKLYSTEEQHVLNPDSMNAYVHSRRWFGLLSLRSTCTQYPVRVHEDASGTYIKNMPLLGALWSGNYESSDAKQIHTALRCGWGIIRGAFRRTDESGNREFDLDATSRNISPPVTLNDVHTLLCMYRDWYETVRDPRTTFTHAYAIMTKVFQERLELTRFINKDWIISRLDIAFAQEYFNALNAHDLGLVVAQAWDNVFSCIADYRTSVFEELILGMSAHILHDLPLVLCDLRKAEQVVRKSLILI